MMIWFRAVLSLCAALACSQLSPARAEGVPAEAVKALQERDQTLSRLTFSWRRSDKEQVFCAMSPAQLKDIRKKELAGWEADYRKRGITNEAKIKDYAQQATQSIMTAFQGGSVAYSNVWSFQRDGSATLASGTTQTFNGFVSTFRQFYDKESAITVFDDNHSVDGQALPNLTPIAWRTSGESVSYPVSSSDGLDLSPEHLAFLLGSNPLSLRGLNWKLQSQSPASLVLDSSFVEEHTNFSVKMTLAVKNGFAPSNVVVQSGHTVERYVASSFRPYKGTWISESVAYSKDAPGFVHEDQVWKLRDVSPSSPIELRIAGNESVRDFRLVGPNLSSQALNRAGMPQDKRFGKIVSYRWPGHFPSEEELTQMQQAQHPAEVPPAPGPAFSPS